VRFSLTQQLPGDPTEAIRLYSDPEFHTSLRGMTKVATPVLVGREVDGDRVTLRLRYQFIAHLPSAVTAVVDPERLSWVDETVYDLGRCTASTVLRPDHYADRLTADIGSTFVAGGPGTVRRIEGDLKVRMLLVGSQVEKAIVSGLEEHLEEEAKVAAVRLGG
jgi:hypothetical protein